MAPLGAFNGLLPPPVVPVERGVVDAWVEAGFVEDVAVEPPAACVPLEAFVGVEVVVLEWLLEVGGE